MVLAVDRAVDLGGELAALEEGLEAVHALVHPPDALQQFRAVAVVDVAEELARPREGLRVVRQRLSVILEEHEVQVAQLREDLDVELRGERLGVGVAIPRGEEALVEPAGQRGERIEAGERGLEDEAALGQQELQLQLLQRVLEQVVLVVLEDALDELDGG